jgi:hypothetical protein
VVIGFSSCLGVPRHASSDPTFTTSALANIGLSNDRLLDLVEYVGEEDPFVALRLLQVCGVQRFGHIISIVPPPWFATSHDETVVASFASIQQEPPRMDSNHSLPVGADGAGVASLVRHAFGSFLGAFLRVAGSLQQRLTIIGGRTNRSFAAMIANPSAICDTRPWARFVCEAHAEARMLETFFITAKYTTANLMAPRGTIIMSDGDPSSVA